MSDLIRQELQSDLHAATLGKGGVSCDCHARPKTLAADEPVLCEAIRIITHSQLDENPDHWAIDAARCSQHAVSAIEEPTRDYEEALVRSPVAVSNGVVSVATPDRDDVRFLSFSPTNEGLHPMLIDQQLLDASEPGDYGMFRWTRVIGMLEAVTPEPVREHIEELIEQSPETPEIGGKQESVIE